MKVIYSGLPPLFSSLLFPSFSGLQPTHQRHPSMVGRLGFGPADLLQIAKNMYNDPTPLVTRYFAAALSISISLPSASTSL